MYTGKWWSIKMLHRVCRMNLSFSDAELTRLLSFFFRYGLFVTTKFSKTLALQYTNKTQQNTFLKNRNACLLRIQIKIAKYHLSFEWRINIFVIVIFPNIAPWNIINVTGPPGALLFDRDQRSHWKNHFNCNFVQLAAWAFIAQVSCHRC